MALVSSSLMHLEGLFGPTDAVSWGVSIVLPHLLVSCAFIGPRERIVERARWVLSLLTRLRLHCAPGEARDVVETASRTHRVLRLFKIAVAQALPQV